MIDSATDSLDQGSHNENLLLEDLDSTHPMMESV